MICCLRGRVAIAIHLEEAISREQQDKTVVNGHSTLHNAKSSKLLEVGSVCGESSQPRFLGVDSHSMMIRR